MTGWINVTLSPYNADPTGATDSTTGIQNAINAAQTNGGGTVYFPNGKYLVSSLNITGDNITLLGDGPQTSYFYTSSTTGTFLNIGQSTVGTLFTNIVNIGFIPKVSRTGYTVYFLNCQGVYMSNVWLGIKLPEGSPPLPTLGHGIAIDNVNVGSSFGVMDAVQIADVSGDALDIGRFSAGVPPGDIFISNCNFGGSGAVGIDIGWASGVYITNSELTGSSTSTYGLVLAPTTNDWTAYIFLDGLVVDTFGSNGIYMTGAGVIADVRLTGCYSNNNNNHGVLFDNSNTHSIGITITGGEFCNNVGAGIEWFGGGGFVINGAMCFANSKNTSAGQNGINATNNASGFQIVNCLSGKGGFLSQTTNNQAWGIQAASGCNNYIIANNRCPGNVTGGISATSSATQIVSNNLAV